MHLVNSRLLLFIMSLPASAWAAELRRGSASAGDERTVVELRIAGPTPRAWLSLPEVGVCGRPA